MSGAWRRAAAVGVAVALGAGCGGGGDEAEGEEFVTSSTEAGDSPETTETTEAPGLVDLEPAATLTEWKERFEPVIRQILEAAIDIHDAVDAVDYPALGEHCAAMGRGVGNARAIGPMPDPADSEWNLALDELQTGVDGCVAAVESGDQPGVTEALRHFDAALVHMTNVTNAVP